ncbi:hypothetical protein LP414_11705 [Polaromonas sp. P1(28)-13]|nr:hypothetical protein LP414_11705 [Polaromonas sp. P1(28)-13]
MTGREALTLVANQNLLLATGASFTISHTLTNTGNIATTYLVTASVAPGSAFTPVNVQAVQDVTGNGQVDAGEAAIPPAAL